MVMLPPTALVASFHDIQLVLVSTTHCIIVLSQQTLISGDFYVVELVSIAENSFKKYCRFPSHQYTPQKLVKTESGVETYDQAEVVVKDRSTKTRYLYSSRDLMYYCVRYCRL